MTTTDDTDWWFLKLTKKFFIDQHGCAKNQVDGELIIARLEKLGFVQTLNVEDSDLIIVNSCGFIKTAKEESLNSLLDARSAYPEKKILLAGCLAERYSDVFSESLPEADGILGNGDLSLLDSVVKKIFKDERPVSKGEQKGVCCGNRTNLLSFKGSAYVKITEGCDNRCTFCAIPIIRGRLRSRASDEIVAEIKELISRGIFEINLIGQDLAAYGCGESDCEDKKKNWHEIIYSKLSKPIIECDDFIEKFGRSPLYDLLTKISRIKGKFWVRLLYIHPDHFNPDILEILKKDSRFLPYFDIPFQSGDSRVIKAMNRKGSASSYRKLVKTIRSELSESCIRTTFLTGFPTESEDEALNSQKFLKAIKSDWSGCFPYSKEDDTPAYKMKPQVPGKISARRASELQSIQSEITAKSLNARCGKEYDVLVEEIVQNLEGTDEGLAIGRAWFQAPEVDGSVVIRYDLDDKNAVKKIVPGNVVRVKAVASSEVDIDSIFLG